MLEEQQGRSPLEVGVLAPAKGEGGSIDEIAQRQAPLPLEQRKLVDSGLSSRHLAYFFGARQNKETASMLAAQKFLASPSLWCLTLLGSNGCGKTFAAEWCLYRSIQSDHLPNSGAVRILRPFDIRSLAGDNAKRQQMQQGRVLILDDLGSEPETSSPLLSWALFDLVDARWRQQRKTIITSNLMPSELRHRYGQRVTERLAHGGICIGVRGPSLRYPTPGHPLEAS